MKPQSATTHFSAVMEKRTRRARTRVSLNATADYDAKVHARYGDGLARRRSMDAQTCNDVHAARATDDIIYGRGRNCLEVAGFHDTPLRFREGVTKWP